MKDKPKPKTAKPKEERVMTKPTIEKDVDLSTDRDATRVVERASFTGTDDKSQAKVFSMQNRVDIGEDESVASNLASVTGAGNNFVQMAVAQQLRHTEELFGQRVRFQEELSAIKQRQLSNSADWDQTMRETTVSHTKSRNSQDVRHADLSIDRIWNIDEQVWAAAKITESLGVDHRLALAAVLEALSGVLKTESKK